MPLINVNESSSFFVFIVNIRRNVLIAENSAKEAIQDVGSIKVWKEKIEGFVILIGSDSTISASEK